MKLNLLEPSKYVRFHGAVHFWRVVKVAAVRSRVTSPMDRIVPPDALDWGSEKDEVINGVLKA